jgi:hypothetical protein
VDVSREDVPEHITSGPRWDFALKAIRDSMRILEEAGLNRGGVGKTMWAWYQSLFNELSSGGHVRPGHWQGWNRQGDAWDPKKPSPLSEALQGDNAIADIRDAERTLKEVGDMRAFLDQTVPKDEFANGWSTELAESLQDALTQIEARLRGGEYLGLPDFEAWDRPLRFAGITRRELRGISYIEADRRRLGVSIDFVETMPPGQWWERVRKFDGGIVNLAGTDLSERSPAWTV